MKEIIVVMEMDMDSAIARAEERFKETGEETALLNSYKEPIAWYDGSWHYYNVF